VATETGTAAGEAVRPAAASAGRRRTARRLSHVLIAVGVLLLAEAVVTYVWGDPVTSVYTRIEQRGLASDYADAADRFAAAAADVEVPPSPDAAAEVPAGLARAAGEWKRSVATGDALGRLTIGRIGLESTIVQGTEAAELRRGPGHYPMTGFPGQDTTVAVAGHRTTFGHPFRYIDDIREGDSIVVEVPYGSFRYRVEDARIVDNGDWSIIEPQGYDRLVLTACHPLYSAEQRYVVFARAVAVDLPGGDRIRLRG
jgi:sortase A